MKPVQRRRANGCISDPLLCNSACCRAVRTGRKLPLAKCMDFGQDTGVLQMAHAAPTGNIARGENSGGFLIATFHLGVPRVIIRQQATDTELTSNPV